MRLGIDFGTTRTVVSVVDQGRYPLAVFETPEGMKDHLPGLALSQAGGVGFGWEGEVALRSIKRVIGGLWPEDPVPGLEGPRALGLATSYLAWVRTMLLTQSNLELGPDEPLQAMVAVPAHASSAQRYLTVEAFRQAGFEVLGLINEPTAAAIEFAERNRAAIGKRSPKRYVVVYDLGGGTFDSSAVSLAGRRFDLLNTEGISRLGGDDFDDVLLDMAAEAAGLELASLETGTRARLQELCRDAKETLGANSRRVMVDLGLVLPDAEPVLLEAQAFFDRCQPLIDRSLALLDKVFQNLAPFGIDPENPRELGAIYLVGGATAFPPVARSLKRRYGRKIQVAPQPHAATAVGLAIAADPEADVFVREATTRHFGVWREGPDGRAKHFDSILLKDTTDQGHGHTVTRTYHPTHTIGHLRFLECTELDGEGQPGGELTPWAHLVFPYDAAQATHPNLEEQQVEPLPAHASDLIRETYHYGATGTLQIRIENLARGYSREFTAPWG